MDPSRLVVPTLAVLFAGRWTSPSIRMVTSACQSCTSILVTLPTLTSATRTRVFRWITTTSGNWAWMVYDPSLLPVVPGRFNELRPCHSHPGITDTHATMTAAAVIRVMVCLPAVEQREAPVKHLVAPSCLAVPNRDLSAATPRRATAIQRATDHRRLQARLRYPPPG